jgi:hypothetical protein
MSNDPDCKLGSLYISSSNGFVRRAELISGSHLKCIIEPAVIDALTKVYCSTKPVLVLLNGKKSDLWSFSEQYNILTIQSEETSTVEVLL